MQVISRPAALLACVSLMNTLAFCGVTTLYGRISAYHRRLRCVCLTAVLSHFIHWPSLTNA